MINGKLNITITKPHNLQVGDKLKWIDEKGNEQKTEVIAVTSPSSFTLNSNNNSTRIFVYGKQVNDFRTVDYDALSMLNISATQELYKMITKLQEETEKLKADADKRNADNEARLKALEAKIDKLINVK